MIDNIIDRSHNNLKMPFLTIIIDNKMYDRPLCMKCLHSEDLHQITLVDYPDVTIKQCAVGLCRCVMSVRKKKEEERKKLAMAV